MKGRCAIRGCSSQLELKKKKNETEVGGLWSVPDDVFVYCLAPKLSRLDLVALSMVSRSYRFVAVLHEIRALRSLRNVDSYMYVYMHMYPDPNPRWFVLHPVQRRLKPVNLNLYPAPAPVAGSCFVKTGWGIYIIGGLVNGKPTTEVTFFDCTDHEVCRVTPMKIARSGASACLIDRQKIYVFGGCWDDVAADSSNWVEVYDIETGTWELLSVFTPKMPLKIKQSVVIFQERVYAVDEDGQLFISPTSEWKFKAEGRTESNPGNRNDWLFADHTLFCRGTGGKILWRFPPELDWKEVKGLEELQQQHCGFDIIKLCLYSNDRMAIFWEARGSQGPDQILELWCAQISMERRPEGGVLEIWGNIEWSGAVLSDSSYTGLSLLFAGSFYA
ncbi:Kelch-type beta propeller [Arabidopsis thaliana x Arabidopsis arenosa]|uniref:Kelch-type beta propeller n=1 Tax=Arabidopsis thaliana x Arabidopsis arenosa TaxID=1240361 RepID=A0A8T2B3C3_9BRAS|nr:Kelch-type beta propeller [Arabidopsis thaliana x Arabidopsis arenosa]